MLDSTLLLPHRGERPVDIQIVMATYNGGRFVAEQLRSVLSQVTHAEFELLIADDGSSDDTLAQVTALAERDARLRLLPSDGQNLGAAQRFARLAELTTAPYVMFCDQDDVWLPDKIERTWQFMRATEARRSSSGADPVPTLVYSDVVVVDQALRVLADSHLARLRVNPRPSLGQLVIENSVTGCTTMANRALLDLALPMPPEAFMHDWWLALAAKTCGELALLPEATLLYRQHGGNVMGSHGTSFGQRLRGFLVRFVRQRGADDFRRSLRQVEALVRHVGSAMCPDMRADLERLVDLGHRSAAAKRLGLLRSGMLPAHFERKVSLLLRLD